MSVQISGSVREPFLILLLSFHRFHRTGVVLLTLHYASDFLTHVYVLAEIFDKKTRLAAYEWFYNIVFVAVRFLIMVLGVHALYYGINTVPALAMLLLTYGFQGHLFVHFIKEYFEKRRERAELKAKGKKGANNKAEKKKKPQQAQESDLPEADQNTNKIKTK